MENEKKSAQELVKRDSKGKFLKGQSGNPAGRPQGSKNKVSLLKISLEEAFRENNFEDMLEIMQGVIEDAKNGDKQARKMVWEAAVSKASHKEDKEGGDSAPNIVIRHMEVKEQGDIIDVTNIEEITDE